jgi:hypothetical protein
VCICVCMCAIMWMWLPITTHIWLYMYCTFRSLCHAWKHCWILFSKIPFGTVITLLWMSSCDQDEIFSTFLTYETWKSHAGQNQVGLVDLSTQVLDFWWENCCVGRTIDRYDKKAICVPSDLVSFNKHTPVNVPKL